MNHDAVMEEHGPYLRLLASVVLQAIYDARTGIDEVADEAMEFLFSDRINVFCDILGYDAEAFKKGLLATQSQRCHDCKMTSMDRTRENRYRFNFKKNYDVYRAKTSD
jgi:hypothetical protein